MNLQNKSLGVSVEITDVLLQRHVEAYFLALRDINGGNELEYSVPERMGGYVRAGCRSGILNTISEEDVDDMSPAAVNWLAAEIDTHIGKASEIPPE
jgi:hypothetical protein